MIINLPTLVERSFVLAACFAAGNRDLVVGKAIGCCASINLSPNL